MIYKSPLHIIPEEYHADLSVSTLKKVKKKLLLQMQLESSITIEINGQEYDKNQLLSAFDELISQPEFHHKLYQNKLLLGFIEKGNLSIFHYRQKREWLDEDDAFRDWALKLFCERLAGVYRELIEKDSFPSTNDIKTIWNSNIILPSKYENIVYTKVHDFLKNKIDYVRNQYSEIVETDNGAVRLKEGLDENINFNWIQIFNYLPSSLKPLRDDYCRWNNSIINQFFSRPELRKLTNISQPDLITLERAARIASIAVNKESNIEFSNKLKLVLRDYEKRKTTFVGLIILFMYFIMLFASFEIIALIVGILLVIWIGRKR